MSVEHQQIGIAILQSHAFNFTVEGHFPQHDVSDRRLLPIELNTDEVVQSLAQGAFSLRFLYAAEDLGVGGLLQLGYSFELVGGDETPAFVVKLLAGLCFLFEILGSDEL